MASLPLGKKKSRPAPVGWQRSTNDTVGGGLLHESVICSRPGVLSAPNQPQRDKVSYIRQKLAEGEYDIEGRLNIILERLCEELVVRDERLTSQGHSIRSLSLRQVYRYERRDGNHK